MTATRKTLGEKFETVRLEVIEKNKAGKGQDAIVLLENAWKDLPGNKYDYDESFIIVWYILHICIEIHDVETMNKWVDKVFLASPTRTDGGEREMWAGRVAYESGEKEKAIDYFRIAYKKSKGRVFGDKDKIYKTFLIENGLTS